MEPICMCYTFTGGEQSKRSQASWAKECLSACTTNKTVETLTMRCNNSLLSVYRTTFGHTYLALFAWIRKCMRNSGQRMTHDLFDTFCHHLFDGLWSRSICCSSGKVSPFALKLSDNFAHYIFSLMSVNLALKVFRLQFLRLRMTACVRFQ